MDLCDNPVLPDNCSNSDSYSTGRYDDGEVADTRQPHHPIHSDLQHLTVVASSDSIVPSPPSSPHLTVVACHSLYAEGTPTVQPELRPLGGTGRIAAANAHFPTSRMLWEVWEQAAAQADKDAQGTQD